MSETKLKEEVLKLAHENPELRQHLLPILKNAISDKEVIDKWAPGARRQRRQEVKRRQEHEKRRDTPGTPEHEHYQKILRNQPKWEKLEGQWILRVPGRPVAALPVTGRKNSRNFIVFDIKKRDEITQLRKDEVVSWLVKEALR